MNLNLEQITRNQHFLRDLRANKLKAKGRMRDENGGQCCLAVALDTAIKDGFRPNQRAEAYEKLPPESMADWYGRDCTNPELGSARSAAQNDGDEKVGVEELTHAELADRFEQRYTIPNEETK